MTDVYHSRTQSHWEFGKRHDPVVWGSLDGPLNPEQLSGFERDGFVVLPAWFSPQEAGQWLAEAEHLATSMDSATREDVITEPDSDVIRSIFRVHVDNPVFKAMVRDRRLQGAARQILGSEVYIHQSRINFKPGFDGRDFYWHSDFETWHIEDGMPTMRAISASVLLTENTPLNGPLMVIPRSHQSYVRCVGETPENHYKQSLKSQHYGVPSHEALSQLIQRGGMAQVVGPPGSVVLFDSNLMHGSVGNLSPYPRHNIFLVYNSIENRLVAPFGGLKPRPAFLGERSPQAVLST